MPIQAVLAFCRNISLSIAFRIRLNSPEPSKKNMGNRLYDFLVDFIARFAAAVLTHPIMNESVLDIVVKGVDKLMEQENLDEHLMRAGHGLAKSRDVMAHKAGKDFPKVAASFVKGMVHIGNPEKKMTEDKNDGDNESKTSALQDSDASDHLSHERVAVATKVDATGTLYSKKRTRWNNPMQMIRQH